MLAETLSCVKAKDRDLGSVVAKDYARYDGARLNINRRGDLRKHDMWHPALLSCAPHRLDVGISSRNWCRLKVACATGLTATGGKGSILTTQTRCGLEHA